MGYHLTRRFKEKVAAFIHAAADDVQVYVDGHSHVSHGNSKSLTGLVHDLPGNGITTGSKTGDLGGRNSSVHSDSVQDQILSLVNEKQDPARKGADFHDCYLAVKREHPELFGQTTDTEE